MSKVLRLGTPVSSVRPSFSTTPRSSSSRR